MKMVYGKYWICLIVGKEQQKKLFLFKEPKLQQFSGIFSNMLTNTEMCRVT
jgi:hypothetical protein